MDLILLKNKFLKLSYILLIISSVANAQNLLNNGDFESGGTGVGFDVNGVGYTQIFAPFSGTTVAGNYAITTNPLPMNTTAPFIAGFDHTTGTGTGKMMVIDGNTTGGNQRFWRAGNTGGGVCGLIVNATYKFSYWIKSVSATTTNAATQAFIDLQFNNANTITLLSGSKTAPLPAGGWVKVVYSFKATNACVNIELWNTTTNPVGNDFAVDDFSVTQVLPLSIAYSAVNPSCPNTNDGFISVYGSGGSPPYTLYNLTGSTTASNSTGIFQGLLAGTYNVSVKDSANNTVFANNIIIAQPANPLVVSPTQHTCPNNTLNLTASAPGASSYSWTATPADATLTNPNLQNQTVSPAVSTVYNVIATTTKTQQLLFNGDFTLGNIGFTSDYLYINPTNTTAAQTAYGVVTNPNSWESTFTTCGDHTTGTGRMMVVDGSTGNAGNNKLWSQTIPVNAGQNYTFSYWIQTVALIIPANIETLINGVSIGFQLAPAVITCGSWTQFTYTWNSGTATSAQIVLYDRVTVGTGNDFALDDLSFTTITTCANSKDIKVNTLFAVFTNAIVPPIVICPNSTYDLNFFGTPNAIVTFSSSTGIFYTVVLDTNGLGTFTTPSLTVNTTFTLREVTRTSPACSATLSDSILISIFKNGCTTVTGGDQGATVGTNSTPPPICTVGECRTLTATYTDVASTTGYIVEPILFCPDTSAIGTQVPIVADDIWSNVIPLPFEFCFFNQNYTTCQVGTNALISFNPHTPGSFCPYNLLSVQIPNTTFVEKNAIYGVYQDVITNPTTPFPNLSVNYKLAGTYPCRKLIVNFTDLSQFSCQNSVGAQTSQIILYEISNVIEIYVKRRQACTAAWNGAGVIGIQNAAGTSAFTPVGRNTGTWSANDEAYRFTPNGPAIPSVFEWLQNGAVVSTNANNFTVCPTTTTTYTAQVKYNVCGVTKTVAAPPVTVEVIPDATVAPQNICFTTNPVDLTVNEPVVLSAVPVANQADYFFTYYATLPDAQAGFPIITNPNSYNVGGFGTVIYMVVENINNPCRIIKSYTFINCSSPCPTITNPSLNQTLCESNIPSNLSVSTTFTGTDAISFVSFPSPQTGNAMYAGGTLLGNATPSGGIATLSSSLIPTAPGSYYIYAIANPPPADATCRPFQLIFVKINVRADAGSSGQIIICDNNTSPINLNNLITGEQTGGTWTRTGTGTGGIFDATNGTFIPAIGTTTSTFDYTIAGLSPCPNDISTATVSINAYANAGTDANPITICDDNTTLIDLNAEITGEQIGGTWTRNTTSTGGVFNATAGTFVPAVGATTSVFTYTVVGNAPCVNDTSTVTVNINPKPNAGTDGTPITICDNSTNQINLFSSITGEQSGGTWTRTGTGGTFDGIVGTFTPAAGATTSTFTYTKTGIAPCIDDTSQVVVNINPEPIAGSDGNVTICDSSTTVIDLNLLITGEQTGGTWIRNTGTGGTFTPIPGTFLPSSGASSSTFTYTKTGVAPCLSDTSIATVDIITQPNAGTDGMPITVCENDTNTINLYNSINGEQTGGTWTRTGTGGNFDALAGTFVPAIGATTSTFTYTLAGLSPCVNDTSQVIVNISPEAKAGTDGTTTICDSNTTAIDLNLLITGEQTGGTWSRNNGSGGTFTAATGIFIPAINATTSTFTYTKTGDAPCPTDTSTVIININHQPNAGADGTATVCGNDTAVINLASLITGEELGGTWTRTSGTGGVFAPATGLYTPAAGATQSTFDYSFTGITPCIDDKSTATIKFNPLPTSSILSTSPSVCKGYAGPTITFTGIGGTAPYVFNYNINGTPLSITTTTGDSVTTTVNTTSAGALTYTIDSVQDANCLNPQNETVVVNVLNAPIVNTPTTFIVCDDNASYDGVGAFDLHSKDNSIRTLPSQVVGYYLTQTDAVVGLNDGVSNPEIIANPYINIAPGTNTPVQIIWVKVIDKFAPQCYTIVQMQLKVNPRPLQNLTLTPLQICDVTAPAVQEPFDLHSKDADIINGQTGVVVNYFATQALADTNNPANALPNQNAYVIPNTPPAPQSATQTIWYNASFTSNGCGTVGPLDLIVNPLPNATQPAYPSYQLCETPTRGATGGLEIFNLDSKISEISLFPAQINVSVTFYLTYNDALANTNIITNTSAYPN
ncbi:MAG: SprB repeat-containing protein, partial [Flavobacterium sp.]|nr:SprB repeat-containing protein [Flavobacterium sp.]